MKPRELSSNSRLPAVPTRSVRSGYSLEPREIASTDGSIPIQTHAVAMRRASNFLPLELPISRTEVPAVIYFAYRAFGTLNSAPLFHGSICVFVTDEIPPLLAVCKYRFLYRSHFWHSHLFVNFVNSNCVGPLWMRLCQWRGLAPAE